MTKALEALRGSTHFEDVYGIEVIPTGHPNRMAVWGKDLEHHVMTSGEGRQWIAAFFNKLDMLTHDVGLPMSNEIAFEVYDDE